MVHGEDACQILITPKMEESYKFVKSNSGNMKEETLIYHQQVVDKLRMGYASGKTRPLEFRVKQLKALMTMFTECQDELLNALYMDMRKSKLEGLLYEIELCKTEIRWLIKNMARICKTKVMPKNVLAILDRAYIRREPYGVVLIIGAWNYPINLNINPLAGALASGNCVLLKPSEVAGNVAQVLAKLLPRYVDSDCLQVVLGEVEETKSLLDNYRFNYIFYTGSTNVGRSIMSVAAKNLTPVTLELGGKSPVYLDDSANIEYAAKRIIWAKLLNLGQTCISPDYILCSKSVEVKFIRYASQVLENWYGTNRQVHPELPRIINKRHFHRIKNLLDRTKGRIVLGGSTDEEDCWIEPTIIADVGMDDSLMSEEIFGPLLPIINVTSVHEAANIINSMSIPLALYTFAKDDRINRQLINNTTSGGVCINDLLFHHNWNGLPFGGVGDSGLGAYHGKYSYETFLHKRSVLDRSQTFLSEKLGSPRYMPFTRTKFRFFQLILFFFDTFDLKIESSLISHLITALLGAFLVFIYFFWINP